MILLAMADRHTYTHTYSYTDRAKLSYISIIEIRTTKNICWSFNILIILIKHNLRKFSTVTSLNWNACSKKPFLDIFRATKP